MFIGAQFCRLWRAVLGPTFSQRQDWALQQFECERGPVAATAPVQVASHVGIVGAFLECLAWGQDFGNGGVSVKAFSAYDICRLVCGVRRLFTLSHPAFTCAFG